MQNKFSFRASLKKSWSLFKTNWVLLVGGLVGYYVINFLIAGITEHVPMFVRLIINIIGTVISITMVLWYWMSGLRIVEGKTISFKGLMNIPTKLIVNTFIVQILRGLIILPLLIIIFTVFFGAFDHLLLFIITVIVSTLVMLYIQLRTGFTLFLSIDYYETMKPWAIIKHAWKVTKSKEWLIVKFITKIALLNILGAIPMGLGLLVTLPLSLLVAVDFYRTHINPKSGATHTEPVHTDMVVKSPEIESPESETETVSEIVMSESTEMNSETGDSETATV